MPSTRGLRHLLRRQRTAEEEALHLIAAELEEQCSLLLRLHALCDDDQS